MFMQLEVDSGWASKKCTHMHLHALASSLILSQLYSKLLFQPMTSLFQYN